MKTLMIFTMVTLGLLFSCVAKKEISEREFRCFDHKTVQAELSTLNTLVFEALQTLQSPIETKGFSIQEYTPAKMYLLINVYDSTDREPNRKVPITLDPRILESTEFIQSTADYLACQLSNGLLDSPFYVKSWSQKKEDLINDCLFELERVRIEVADTLRRIDFFENRIKWAISRTNSSADLDSLFLFAVDTNFILFVAFLRIPGENAIHLIPIPVTSSDFDEADNLEYIAIDLVCQINNGFYFENDNTFDYNIATEKVSNCIEMCYR